MNKDATAAQAEFDKAAEEIIRKADCAGHQLACRMGCAACCYSLVSLMPQEAFALARHIQALPDEERGVIRALVLEHAAVHGSKDGETRIREHIRCPCLHPVTRECRIYDARPLTCRGMNSIDAKPCNLALEDRDAFVPVPTLQAMHQEVQARFDALAEKAEEEGGTTDSVELSQALAAIWRLPDAEARWHAGEDIFADCRIRDIERSIPRFVPRPRDLSD
ncbi:MAG: YkgJ family cysteine cluster protein [Pseudomonadota bacterium]